MTKLVLACCIFVSVGFAPSALYAQDSRPLAVVSLRADLPEDCADDAQLVHRIEALLGRDLAESTAEPLRVRVSVVGDRNRGYAAEISFSSSHGDDRRRLEHPNCNKLIEAVALVIALAVDPDAVHATERHNQTGEPPAAPGASKPPSAAVELPRASLVPGPTAAASTRAIEAEPARADASTPLRGLRLGLAGALAGGALPALGEGLQATVGFQRSSLRGELIGRYWAPRAQAVPIAPQASMELDLATLGVRMCWLPLARDWSVAVCAGADSGDLRGTGNGLDAARTTHARYSDLTGGVRVSYSRWRLAPEGGFEAAGAIERPGFGVRENGLPRETYRPASWGLVAFLGAAFQL
ncbi:MAG TPA: hypothetical protein VGJ91_24455 [Polyangiaceae bacterium]